MAMSSGQVGANLKVFKGAGLSMALGRAMNHFFRMIGKVKATTPLGDTPCFKIFVKAGAPATNTAADSPGSNLCFIWDSTNKDLYFIYAWTAAATFTSLKVID